MILIACFVSMVFLYGLVSLRLERSVVSAPMMFTVALAVSGTEGAGAVMTRVIVEQLGLRPAVGLHLYAT